MRPIAVRISPRIAALPCVLLAAGCSSESSTSAATPKRAPPGPTACAPPIGSSGLRIATIGGGEAPRAEANLSEAQAEAVGALALGRSGSLRVFCSGTLVTDRLVVTAAHCLLPAIYEAQGAKAPAAAAVKFVIGSDVAKPRHVFDVAEVHLAPEADVVPVGTQYGPDVVVVNDLAALVLSESVVEKFPDVSPIPWNDRPLDAERVGALTVTGAYGGTACAPSSPSGPRAWAASRLTAVEARYLRMNEIGDGRFAHGDSGGGALMAFPDGSMRLVGVLSSTLDPKCESTAFQRVDPLDAWLRGIARERLAQSCDHDACGVVRCRPIDAGPATASPANVSPAPPRRACGALLECLAPCTELWCAHQCSLGSSTTAREKWSAAYRCQACSLGLENTACGGDLKGACVDACKDGDATRCVPCFQTKCKPELDACTADL